MNVCQACGTIPSRGITHQCEGTRIKELEAQLSYAICLLKDADETIQIMTGTRLKKGVRKKIFEFLKNIKAE